MFENSECRDCCLASRASYVCLPSIGGVNCKLAIWLDSPSAIEDRRGRSMVGDNAEFVKFCLRRMSVPLDQVFMDYIVKCCPGKMPGQKADRMACVSACSQYRFAALEQLVELRAMVVLGSLGCEVITQHKTIGDRAGAEWEPASLLMKQFINHVWVGFSPGLLKEKPSEAGSIFRVIWMAAVEAGLKPVINLKLKSYEFAA